MNIAFIPVRGGSKSIPLKNIKLINGKPLVYWAMFSANNSQCIDKVIIATDNTLIKDTVLSFNLKKVEVYDRNPINAQDTSSTESVMLEYINNKSLNNSDLMFLIQATSPMLKSEHIDNMYKMFLESKCDSMFTCVREKQFHWIETQSGIEPVNYDYNKRPRRQEFKGLLAENGACYINSIKNIKENRCRLSGKIGCYELPAYTGYEIDEENDWIIVESIMNHVSINIH